MRETNVLRQSINCRNEFDFDTSQETHECQHNHRSRKKLFAIMGIGTPIRIRKGNRTNNLGRSRKEYQTLNLG